MNKFQFGYDNHSIFLRQKSNEKIKDRLAHIGRRENAYFLPKICKTEQSCNTKKNKQVSVLDKGNFIIFY